jgi:hypothetical protein
MVTDILALAEAKLSHLSFALELENCITLEAAHILHRL